MVINEKGLLSAMKAAAGKGGPGYRVAGIEMNGRAYLLIFTGYWMAAVEKNNAPRKALGLIAEHVGRIPETGEAYRVKKEETQDMIFGAAVKPIMDILRKVEDRCTLPRVQITRLTWEGQEIWQREKDLQISMFNPEYTRIAILHNQDVRQVEGALQVSGNISMALVMPRGVAKEDLPAVNHLERMQWVNI